MFQRHVADDLAAYEDGRLDARAAARVDAHLARCGACRAALADVRHGRRLVASLHPVAMPPDQVARLEARLRRPEGHPGRWHLRPLVAAAALVLAVAGLYVARPLLGLGLDLQVAHEPVGLEQTANDVHERLAAGTLGLDLPTSDPARILAWQREREAPETPLSARAIRAGAPDVRLRGASLASVAGVRLSVVAAHVDGRPVTLIAASERDVPPAPRRAWLTKRVYVHRTASGRPALTWSSGGETFAIVSDLSGLGQTACVLCHTAPMFKRSVDAAAAEILKSSNP